MSSSSKTNSPSKSGSAPKAGPFPNISPEVAAEIAHLMRTPGAMSEGMQRPDGRSHYDPNQPRVPAGDPKGGQFASKGYRGGESDRNARVAQASPDGARLAQLGQGYPRDAHGQPFEGQVGHIRADQHLTSQSAFRQIDSDRRRQKDERDNFETNDGRYRFVSTGPFARGPVPGGTRWVISSTTYAYDDKIGAYATISATPARPIIIDYDGKLRVTPVDVRFNKR